MYDSPIEWCPIAQTYVALDESEPDCRAVHQCGTAECPLSAHFQSMKVVPLPPPERVEVIQVWFGS